LINTSAKSRDKTSQDVVLLFRAPTSVIHVVWRDDLRAKIDPDDHSVRVGGDNRSDKLERLAGLSDQKRFGESIGSRYAEEDGRPRLPTRVMALCILPAKKLHHILPAVDGHRRAGDEPGLGGDEKDHAAADFLRFAKPPYWNQGQD
jgi:hypothetical protein